MQSALVRLLLLAAATALSRDPVDFLFEQVQKQQIKSLVERRGGRPVAVKAETLIKPVHLVAVDSPPVVEPSTAYEGTGCATATSAALRSCQIFAEQTCYNPNLADAVALTIQSTRLEQLGGSDFQVHATSYCRRRHCDDAACDNPAEPGERERCIPCLEVCNAACLVNVELACLKKVCASALGSASSSSLAAVAPENRDNFALLLSRWQRSFLVRSPGTTAAPGACTDEAVKAADTTVIGPGGLTYTSALVSCVENYFSVDKISSTISDPSRPRRDSSCAVVDRCPRDNRALAADRAAKMWSDLAAPYSANNN